MKYYNESAQQLPISYEVDVLVVGSGPAGFGAAMRAGRMGAKTLIIEAQDRLGGIATAGLMSHWAGRSSSKIFEELLQRGAQLGEDLPGASFKGVVTRQINHENLKNLMFDMLLEAGVQVLLYTSAVKSVVEDGKIVGVIIENKSGRSFVRAKAVVDGSGDGDVAASAGVPFTLGRESDHLMQPCTIMFKIANVDYERAVFPGSFETKVETEKGELQQLAREILPHPAGHVLLYPATQPGIVVCNMTNAINVDGTNAESITKATYECNSQVDKIVKFLREYAPGYEQCYLLSTATLLGIRETRHFEGIKSIQKDDILEARYYDDWCVREAHFNFDVHNLTGPSLDKTGAQHEFKQNSGYTIPYGCLVPVNVDRLLLSGRNISGSHIAHSNFRVMPICIALGEAAGAAAAISAKNDCAVRDIDPHEIQAAIC